MQDMVMKQLLHMALSNSLTVWLLRTWKGSIYYFFKYKNEMFSVIFLTQLCLPHLETTKGNVVNVSSVYGLRPVW
jgi:hypothetical protein